MGAKATAKKTARKRGVRKTARKPPAKRARKKAGCKLVGTKEERMEKFVRLILQGDMEPWRCYIAAGWTCSVSAAKTGASKMLKNPNVAGRLEELRAELRKREAEALLLTLQEKREVCAAIVRTPLSKIGPDSPLCAEYRERYDAETGALLERVVKKVPTQFGISEDNKMMGDYAAEKVEVSHSHQIAEEIMDKRDI